MDKNKKQLRKEKSRIESIRKFLYSGPELATYKKKHSNNNEVLELIETITSLIKETETITYDYEKQIELMERTENSITSNCCEICCYWNSLISYT